MVTTIYKLDELEQQTHRTLTTLLRAAEQPLVPEAMKAYADLIRAVDGVHGDILFAKREMIKDEKATSPS